MSPFGARLNIGRLAGVPVFVDWTWFIIFALVTWSLAVGVLPRLEVDGNSPGVWLLAAAGAVLYLLCILLHELSHCLVARRERVPIRDITLFLFGGVAAMEEEPSSARSELRIALAGPASNAGLSALCYAEALAFDQFVFTHPLASLFVALSALNLVIGAFNLIPAFPLDGGRVFRAALWILTNNLHRATFAATVLGEGFALVLALMGAGHFVRGNPFMGMWLVFLGGFLFSAAFEAYGQLRLRQALEGVPVGGLISLNDNVALEDGQVGEMDDCGSPSILPSFLPSSALAVSPATDAWRLLGEMARAGVYRAVVVDKEKVVGLIERRDLVKVVGRRVETETTANTVEHVPVVPNHRATEPPNHRPLDEEPHNEQTLPS